MSAVSAPFGLRCVYHPSGEPRIATLDNGIASGYATPLYNGTPVKLADDGTLVATVAGPDSTIGIFAGCFFIKNGVSFQQSYWLAGQTYDPDTPMWAQYQTLDTEAIYEGQANGSVGQIKLGETINLADASTGSTFTGQSIQRLDATTTGAVPGTFIVQNVAPYSDNDWGDPFTIVRVRINTAPLGAFPWNDPDLIWDMDFTEQQVRSGSLGFITIADALTEARTTTTWVQGSDGLLFTAAAGVPAIAIGTGLWSQVGDTCRMDFNNDLSQAAWVKTNMTVAQNLPSAFATGSPAGWRITATAANATILQTTTPLTPGSVTTSLPHAMFYWDGTPLNGAVEITQYNFAVATDIRPYLVAGQWVQIPGAVETITGANNISGVRIGASGDSIGFCLLNVSRATYMPSPILTTGAGNVTRDGDYTTVNLANFPTLYDKTKFTILTVVVPSRVPLPADADMGGWTALEINNAFNITATGVGGLVANGMGDGHSTMTVTAPPSFGAFVAGDRMVVGTGVGSYQDIVSQLTGTPGGMGTYDLVAPISLYPNGQTTATPIVLQARLKDAQGYGLNAATKDAFTVPPYRRNVGVTFTNEPTMDGYGVDPQTAQWEANEPNAMGWSIDTTALSGIVALKGDIELTDPVRLTVAPVLNSSIIVNFGCAYPGIGPYLNGYTLRSVAIGRALNQAEMAAATAILQAIYV